MKTRIIAAITLSLVLTSAAQAQFNANFQTVTINVVSNWTGDYNVGNTNFSDTLLIENGGFLTPSTGNGNIGVTARGSNNTVIVTDSGSVWSNNQLLVGNAGVGNSLVISNGGYVYCGFNGAVIGFSSSNNSVTVTGPGSAKLTGLTVGYAGSANHLTISDGGTVFGGGDVATSTASRNNTVLVTDPGSIWYADVRVGDGGPANTMVISNGAKVIGGFGYIGYGSTPSPTSSNNLVVVTGSDSVWSNSQDFYVGYSGKRNRLVISDGGKVVNGPLCGVGSDTFSSSNSVLVTDSGSVWSNSFQLSIGGNGFGNSMVISNGGVVVDQNGYLGSGASIASSNTVIVTGTGSLWQNGGSVYVGYAGASNVLLVTGGSVLATNLVVGYTSAFLGSTNCDNLVRLDSGSLFVTNAAQNAVLEVARGTLILNGGVLQVDKLVITNACARFVHAGGTLILGSLVLDPNKFRSTAVTATGNDILLTWRMGPGATNALQAAPGDVNGGYSTNAFSDIFVVTNNAAAGTVTNYLDVGAATNKPSRFYRVRLVP